MKVSITKLDTGHFRVIDFEENISTLHDDLDEVLMRIKIIAEG